MDREVIPVDAFTSVKQAIDTMGNRSLHIVTVCQDGEPISALTECDTATSGAAYEGPSSSVTLEDIVKRHVEIRCYEDAILADAIPAMAGIAPATFQSLMHKGTWSGPSRWLMR